MPIPDKLISYLKATGTSPGKLKVIQRIIDREPKTLEEFYVMIKSSSNIAEGTLIKIKDFVKAGGQFEEPEDVVTILKDVKADLEKENAALKEEVATLKVEVAEQTRRLVDSQDAKHKVDGQLKETREQLDRLTTLEVESATPKVKSPAAAAPKKPSKTAKT